MDIDERKRAEQERERLDGRVRDVQKLETLGTLAGGIAHDFNNLLQAILSNAALVRLHSRSMPAVQGSLNQIELAARRAAELTNQLLAYAGKGKFVVEWVDLSRLAFEMSNLLEASIPKNARTLGQFPAELPTVKGDPTQLRQLAMNLIMNAADSLPEGAGVIRLSTGLVDLSSENLSRLISGAGLAAGRYVYFEVCDTGCGMTEEVKSKIFDPFFSTKGQGRGLGLAAVLGIVRGHQGALQVDSESGSGTVVRVFLPASERTVTLQPSAPPKNRIGQTGPATILVVDDMPAVLDSARLLLESMGFSVLTAGDGLEAVDIFRTRSAEIGAVLLDLSMPAMTGADVFRELRSLCPDVPILLTSGYSEEEAVQAFQERGLAGFIQKPYRTEELRAKLSVVLQRESSVAKPV